MKEPKKMARASNGVVSAASANEAHLVEQHSYSGYDEKKALFRSWQV